MKTCFFLTFPDKKRIYTWCNLVSLPPLHTYIVFPTNHSEVKGFLSTMVSYTNVSFEKSPDNDYQVVELMTCFSIDMETFLKDQKSVGRFEWGKVSEEPT
jgi:hypothetical protein